ncbi:MAG: hypothetical protein ABIJ00_03640 [Candidatus Eisenbacteria bacterium]
MKKSMCVCLSLLVVFAASGLFAGPKVEFGDDSYLQFSFLGQFHGRFVDQEDALENDDIFMKRGRFIVAGQIADGIKVFVETDNANAGMIGSSSSTVIQDAFIDLGIGGSGHWVMAGLILLPFSFENGSSAASLLGIDYNSEAVKFTNHFVWRDYGAMLHGSIANKFAYSVGVFDGYDNVSTSVTRTDVTTVTTVKGKNPEAGARLTGHVHYALLGAAQSGWFYAQDRLGKAGDYVLVGAGLDMQTDATFESVVTVGDGTTLTSTTIMDSENWVVDCQAGMDLGSVDGVLNAGFYEWDSTYKGNTFFTEAGVRKRNAMLTLKYSQQSPDEGDDTTDFTYGLHYFLKGHSTVAGIEYRTGDSISQALCAIKFLL